MNLIILGPQGSGKGTQAHLLSEKYNLKHLSVGKIFRRLSREDSALGKEVDRVINEENSLVSDHIVEDILKGALEEIPSDQGLILDGAPRRLDQVSMVDGLLEKYGRPAEAVVYLFLSEEESIRRISKRFYCSLCHEHYILDPEDFGRKPGCSKCGGKIIQRKDDTPDGVRKRLKTFGEETLPAIGQYQKKGLVLKIDAGQSVEKVFESIVGELEKRNLIPE